MSDEFRGICKQIRDEYERGGLTGFVDSDDLYQTANFCGGWSEEAGRFWFSYYAPDGGDYMFSFTVDEAVLVAGGGDISPTLEYWKEAPPW